MSQTVVHWCFSSTAVCVRPDRQWDRREVQGGGTYYVRMVKTAIDAKASEPRSKPDRPYVLEEHERCTIAEVVRRMDLPARWSMVGPG
jgi:hypothetical protein